MGKQIVTVNVNGKKVEKAVEPRTLLIHFLREECQLTGAHIGCETSHCGACTVDLDGALGQELHPPGRPVRRLGACSPSKASPRARCCTRCRKASTRSTACNAASARPAC